MTISSVMVLTCIMEIHGRCLFQLSPRLISSLEALRQVSFRTPRANHSGLTAAQICQSFSGVEISIPPMTVLTSLLEIDCGYRLQKSPRLILSLSSLI